VVCVCLVCVFVSFVCGVRACLCVCVSECVFRAVVTVDL
jgi:hypothetical protein